MTNQRLYSFNWRNLAMLTLTQALPAFIGLALVTYAFKFALIAQMNQGAIPSLFSICSIYISILFYFCFKEVISCSKIFGILLMLPCVLLLSFDKKVATEATDLT